MNNLLELPKGCLKNSTDLKRNKKVLVTWEHEEILYIEKHDHHSNVVLVNPAVCTRGVLYPPEAFTSQFNKLKLLLEKCQAGEMSFLDFLKKIGRGDEEEYSSLNYLFL
jgi:hypothetical protein